jgi:lysophospholipase L1-like esterase
VQRAAPLLARPPTVLIARLFAGILTAALFGAAALPAQESDHRARIDALEQQIAAQQRLLHDWAGLIRYGSENTEIPKPKPGERRVVFLGDETTEQWGANGGEFFLGKPYFNRGIAGQTTPQMLVRFRQDVISLRPKAVVILAGANDIAGMAGQGTQGMMIENFQSMVELAKANNIAVVVASILPVCDCGTNQTRRRPVGKILGNNDWLEEYAAQTGSVYLNYYSALVEGRAFRKEWTADGFVPNAAGYRVMAPLAEKAIAEALGEAER